MNREDAVIIFKDKSGELKCKLCAAPSNFNRGYFCFNGKPPGIIMDCVGYYMSEAIKGKCFDNSVDEIILTENTCRLCSVCDGMDKCEYNIKKYIRNYMKHVKEGKVEHDYDRE